MQSIDHSDYISITEAAKRLSFPESTIEELIIDGSLIGGYDEQDSLGQFVVDEYGEEFFQEAPTAPSEYRGVLISSVTDLLRQRIKANQTLVEYKPCVVNDLRDKIDCRLRDQFGYGHLSLDTYRLDAWHMYQSHRPEEDAYTPYNDGDLKWHLSTLKEKFRMA